LAPMRGRRAAKREPGTAWNRGEPQSGALHDCDRFDLDQQAGRRQRGHADRGRRWLLAGEELGPGRAVFRQPAHVHQEYPELDDVIQRGARRCEHGSQILEGQAHLGAEIPSCITWPSAETLVWPDTKMTLWAPVTFHAWEKPRRSCQVHGLIWVFSTRHPPVFCLSRCVLWLARSAYPHGPPRHRVRPSLRQAGRERDGQRNAVRVFEVDDGAGGHLDQPGVLHAVLVEPGDPRFQVLASGDGETDVVEPRPPGREALSAGSAEPD